jgi:putative nucleotidyltransferase-like protein
MTSSKLPTDFASKGFRGEMVELFSNSRGRMVATMLTGSWRYSPPAFGHSAAEVEEIAPLLLNSGAAALCWWRVRHCELRAIPAATQLQDIYRLNILRAAIQQQAIQKVFTRLRSNGIEPILVKGWAIARLYPEQGLRPCGDIDLCVRPEQFAEAERALSEIPEGQYDVDLHCGFAKFGDCDADEIYARSRLVKLGETDVRVLCPEDQLRVIAIHMLREGAWRPLWLCDIAVAVESRSAEFDWTVCLTENRRQADWVTCAIRLAGQLLGADISCTPAAESTKALPRWLTSTILKEWGAQPPSMTQRHRAPMASFLRSPAGVLKGLRHRWPNPIEATISMGGLFRDSPRIPFQLGNCLARTAKFTTQLPKSLRRK